MRWSHSVTAVQSPSILRPTQGVGAVGGVEVFVELVGERAVVEGVGEVVPGWWIRGEEGVATCSS